MNLSDLLPKRFVASDFVTNQRLKYEASPTRRKVVDGAAYATGAIIGGVGSYIIHKAIQKSVQN